MGHFIPKKTRFFKQKCDNLEVNILEHVSLFLDVISNIMISTLNLLFVGSPGNRKTREMVRRAVNSFASYNAAELHEIFPALLQLSTLKKIC